ncbi:LOB domain-containing protein [Heracleum sosnowskyi]|uniref:LOB domain-containing protein n=1 Tax=Heracleum sosnowskyi TaxID=360622 RepID=A0AAD8M5B6_9APIA|nr:LOB domain-containing protein [Heracleum sosnowskyi]
MSSSNSPCAACKFLRRKCTQECVFAPYFPPDQPQKFANVHRVFGASNVAKLLNDLSPEQREDAVSSLAYEAEARLRDPVYGCVGLISILQHKLKQVQFDLINAKKELANYIGASAMLPILQHPGLVQQGLIPQHPSNPQNVLPYNMQPVLGLSPNQAHGAMPLVMHDQQQQNILEAQQFAVAEREQQELIRSYEQQQPPDQLVQFNNGFDMGEQVTDSGFDQAIAGGSTMSLQLGSYEGQYNHQIQEQQPEETPIHHSQLLQIQPQLLLHQQQQHIAQSHVSQQQHQPREGREEGRTVGLR